MASPLLNLLLGTNSLPTPTGPFKIATKTLHWEHDPNFKLHEDELTHAVKEHEEKLRTHMKNGVIVKVWFPMDDKSITAEELKKLKKAPYMNDDVIPFAQKLAMDRLPESLSKYYLTVVTNAFEKNSEKIQLAKDLQKYPVLIFSHGLYGNAEFYSNFCENAASHGFVVFSAQHSDGSCLRVQYPKKRLASQVVESAAAADTSSSNSTEGAVTTTTAVSSSLKESEAEKQDVNFSIDFERGVKENRNEQQEKEEFQLRNRQVKQRTHNVKFMLDRITKLAAGIQGEESEAEEDSFLRGRLDASNIGMFGHSFGGATTLECCSKYHSQIKAAVLLDSWLYPVDVNTFLQSSSSMASTPIMFINSDQWQWRKNLLSMHRVMHRLSQVTKEKGSEFHGYLFKIPMSLHQNFSDVAATMPKLGKIGKILGGDSLAILKFINKTCMQFFYHYLNYSCPRDSLAVQQLIKARVSQNEVLPELKQYIWTLPADFEQDVLNSATSTTTTATTTTEAPAPTTTTTSVDDSAATVQEAEVETVAPSSIQQPAETEQQQEQPQLIPEAQPPSEEAASEATQK